MKGKPCTNTRILLATAIIKVKYNLGKEHECQVLLDNASQMNFISKNMAERLNMKFNKFSAPIDGINGMPAVDVKHTCSVDIHSKVTMTSA
jgi:hypothetical protein